MCNVPLTWQSTTPLLTALGLVPCRPGWNESCTAASVQTVAARRITVGTTNRHACVTGATRFNNRLLTCLLQQSLSPSHTNDYRRNIFHIHESVEVFRASKIGEMNDVVRYLCEFAAHFLSRSQVQFDTFTCAPLKKADHGRVRLQGGFLLGKRAGTGYGPNDDSNKKRVAFHNQLLLDDCSSVYEQIIAKIKEWRS